jgi:hypothetical protein
VRIAAVSLVGIVTACGGGSHRHGPSANQDPNTLFVETYTNGSHGGALHRGARAGLSHVRFAVPVDHGGEIELQVEVASLGTAGDQTTCKVKILVLRLPQHDLLGIADGAARAGGTDDRAADDCIEAVTATLVRNRVRTLLQRHRDAKR